jgi:sugar phosphate isomerase/epimerase
MHDRLGPSTKLGYCTNVHAGADYAQTLANLDQHATAVKQQVAPAGPMGVGLWLSASAARQVVAERRGPELRDWLEARGLDVFTLNGFPYGDFHSPTVKHRVYRPNWTEQGRVDYTRDLIDVLTHLLPAGGEGSISTLPLGWANALAEPAARKEAAAQLTDIVHWLARVELDTGKYIHLDLEPEPGCALDTSADIVNFFQDYLLGGPDDRSVLAYLRVCHDVCHAAVMGEDQTEVIERYRQAGLSVGKVQLSSAIHVPFDQLDANRRDEAWDQLRQFNEPRYLHQTTVSDGDGPRRLFDDLPEALNDAEANVGPAGDWRVHFHVPLFLDRFGQLQTTQQQVRDCLAAIKQQDKTHHFEVETYAWSVLPPALQPADLATGLAQEMQWVLDEGQDHTESAEV